MAAYTAVISLLQTLEQLQKTSPKLIQGQTAETLDSLCATAEYFHSVLEEASDKGRFDPEKIKSLEEKIRVAASYTEDVVELKISQIIKDMSWTFGILQHEDLSTVVEKMDTTKKQVMEIVSNFNTRTHDADDDQLLESAGDSLTGATSSRSNSMLPNLKDEIVQGLDEHLEKIVERLRGPQSDLDIVTITGMGGIGKTTLATKAHDHLEIRYHFDIRIWVTISQEYQSRNLLLDALHCISKQTNFVNVKDYDKKHDELADLVRRNLMGRRYLAVVDDIWSMDVWDEIAPIFPDCNNRSRILLTTRDAGVAMYADSTSPPHEMNLLNSENSWKLLRDKVFGPTHDHPPELERTGKKIAEKCQGLPLMISVIAGHLSKMARTLQSWKDVAQTLAEIIASHPDKCLGVLGLSYHHLPNHLKPCFLSMGSFPEDFQVETWRLIQLWIAEGFIRTFGSGKSLEEVAVDYLKDLINRGLITAGKRRFNGDIKTCAMHDLLREFCLIEAEMANYVLVERTDQVPSTLSLTQKHDVRRFSFQTQYYSVDECCKLLPPVARSIYSFKRPSTTRYSFLGRLIGCHPVPLEVLSRFNLLKVLAIFHEELPSFPLVITKLFHLRYLEIVFDGDLPASISELQNLQTLIYKEGFIGKTLPGSIWIMENLRCIHLGRASYLPSPRRESIQTKHLAIGMPNLEELFGLCFTSCTNEVFSSIPNLKRLIAHLTASSRTERKANLIIDMSSLTKLEVLKCVRYTSWSWPRISIKRFVFPTSLKRLTLAGKYYFPWEDISSLVKLPNLEELKLKKFAVSGEVWRLSDEDKFGSLKLLLFSELYLERWEASSDSFPNLKRLVLKKCDCLREIPTDFGEICSLESIELHECSSAAENSARKIEQEQEDMGNNFLKIYIKSSPSY